MFSFAIRDEIPFLFHIPSPQKNAGIQQPRRASHQHEINSTFVVSCPNNSEPRRKLNKDRPKGGKKEQILREKAFSMSQQASSQERGDRELKSIPFSIVSTLRAAPMGFQFQFGSLYYVFREIPQHNNTAMIRQRYFVIGLRSLRDFHMREAKLCSIVSLSDSCESPITARPETICRL